VNDLPKICYACYRPLGARDWAIASWSDYCEVQHTTCYPYNDQPGYFTMTRDEQGKLQKIEGEPLP